MKTIKLKIDNVVDSTKILIALKKQTIKKTWKFHSDDFGGQVNRMYEVEEILDEEIDLDHIYFNDMVPENRTIELPVFLLHKDILFRARTDVNVPMREFEHNITLMADTTLSVIQIPDD
jgi:hypothetical protein